MKLSLDKNKFIRALRLLIAIMGGIICSWLFHIPMSAWVIVTTTVVLFDQETVGATLNRGRLRFLATVSGATTSLICILLFGNQHWLLLLVVAISAFTYAYLYMGSKSSYIGVLGTATVAILVVGTHQNELTTALYRLTDIILGIALAVIAMLLFFPQYAFDKAQQLLLASISDIRNSLVTVASQRDIHLIRQQMLLVETKFIQDVSNFNKTLDDAKSEIRARKQPQLITVYAESIIQIRRLYRLLLVIFYYQLEDQHLHERLHDHLLIAIIDLLNAIMTMPSDTLLHKELFQRSYSLTSKIEDRSLAKSVYHFINELNGLANKLQAINHYHSLQA